MEQGLGNRVRTGYLWTLLGVGLEQPLSFVIGVALARILSPSEFGIIASCVIFTEVASTVVSSGYVSGLLQRREVSPLDLSTGFVLQLATSVGIALLLVGVAPFAGYFLGNHMIGPVLSVLSLNLILLAFSSTPSVIARRSLDFRLLMLVRLVQVVTHGVVAFGMAWAGHGVWSLVGGKLASQLVWTLQLSYATAWRPSFRFSRSVAVSLWGISAQFVAKNILDDLARNVDYFIVSWRLGVEPLGFYFRAYSLMTLPITRFSTSLGDVLFPAFSKIQDEPEQLIRSLVKSSCLISMMIFPLLVGLQLVAPILIPLVYGPQWLATVQPLQILCLAGLFYSLDPTLVALINAKGYLMDEIRRQLAHLALLVTCVLGGSSWGTEGVAWGVVLAASVYWILMLRLLKRRIGFFWSAYLEGLIPGGLASLAMAVVIIGFQKTVSLYGRSEGTMSLLGSIGVGGLSYLVFLWVIRRMLSRPVLNEAFEEVEVFLEMVWNRTVKVLAMREKWRGM